MICHELHLLHHREVLLRDLAWTRTLARATDLCRRILMQAATAAVYPKDRPHPGWTRLQGALLKDTAVRIHQTRQPAMLHRHHSAPIIVPQAEVTTGGRIAELAVLMARRIWAATPQQPMMAAMVLSEVGMVDLEQVKAQARDTTRASAFTSLPALWLQHRGSEARALRMEDASIRRTAVQSLTLVRTYSFLFL